MSEVVGMIGFSILCLGLFSICSNEEPDIKSRCREGFVEHKWKWDDYWTRSKEECAKADPEDLRTHLDQPVP